MVILVIVLLLLLENFLPPQFKCGIVQSNKMRVSINFIIYNLNL